MDHTERQSGESKSGCKNCGSCKKGGCASIVAGLEIDNLPRNPAILGASASGNTATARILAAE